MTNIWAGIYKEIRDPFFDMNDPYVMSEEKKEKEKEKEEKGEKPHKEGSAEEKAEDKKGENENGKKRWWDDDGDGVGYEKGEVSGSFGKKKVRKEERELHSKNDKNEKLDVRKGIKNKIDVNPKEELEAWIQELLAEGFDLSQFTLDEIVDIYESAEELDEADSYGMPARGDAETARPDPLAAAKKRAAQAQIRKELSDLQVAKARATARLTPASEAVLAYVAGRTPLYEAVFDPKKSKLKPASERTKKVMTDAERKAKEKEAKRTAEIHSKGETVLAGLRPQGKRGKVQTTPAPKPAAPEANRTVKGRQDKLASAADKVLKNLKNK